MVQHTFALHERFIKDFDWHCAHSCLSKSVMHSKRTIPGKFSMWYSQQVTRRGKLVQPGEEPFHFPAPKVAAQFPSILAFASALPVRGDVVFFGELLVERVRVVSLVADEPGG